MSPQKSGYLNVQSNLPQSLLISGKSSEHVTSGAMSHYHLEHDEETKADKKLFREILQQQTADFMKINLSFDTGRDDEVNSPKAVLMLLKVFINWNKGHQESALHFYCGDLLERQVSVSRIQNWWRQVRRVKMERQALLDSQL